MEPSVKKKLSPKILLLILAVILACIVAIIVLMPKKRQRHKLMLQRH